MKAGRIATAILALTTIFGTAAAAQPADLNGCTRDGKTATLKVDIDGSIEGGDLHAVAAQAWQKTIRGMTAAEMGRPGPDGRNVVNLFLENIHAALKGKTTSRDVSVGVQYPPPLTFTSGCGAGIQASRPAGGPQ